MGEALTDREIDALVAEKVLGARIRWNSDMRPDTIAVLPLEEGGVPPYTAGTYEGWAAMPDVIEAMETKGWSGFSLGGFPEGWGAEFWREGEFFDEYAEIIPAAPKAVALAALRALGVEVARG